MVDHRDIYLPSIEVSWGSQAGQPLPFLGLHLEGAARGGGHRFYRHRSTEFSGGPSEEPRFGGAWPEDGGGSLGGDGGHILRPVIPGKRCGL